MHKHMHKHTCINMHINTCIERHIHLCINTHVLIYIVYCKNQKDNKEEVAKEVDKYT